MASSACNFATFFPVETLRPLMIPLTPTLSQREREPFCSLSPWERARVRAYARDSSFTARSISRAASRFASD